MTRSRGRGQRWRRGWSIPSHGRVRPRQRRARARRPGAARPRATRWARFIPCARFPSPARRRRSAGSSIGVDASTDSLRRALNAPGARPGRQAEEGRGRANGPSTTRPRSSRPTTSSTLLAEAVRLLEQSGWTREGGDPGPGAAGGRRGRQRPRARSGRGAHRSDPPRRRRDGRAAPGRPGPARDAGRRRPKGRKSDLYRMLGNVALEIARQAGLEPAAAERTRRALTRKVAATRRRSRK